MSLPKGHGPIKFRWERFTQNGPGTYDLQSLALADYMGDHTRPTASCQGLVLASASQTIQEEALRSA